MINIGICFASSYVFGADDLKLLYCFSEALLEKIYIKTMQCRQGNVYEGSHLQE